MCVIKHLQKLVICYETLNTKLLNIYDLLCLNWSLYSLLLSYCHQAWELSAYSRNSSFSLNLNSYSERSLSQLSVELWVLVLRSLWGILQPLQELCRTKNSWNLSFLTLMPVLHYCHIAASLWGRKALQVLRKFNRNTEPYYSCPYELRIIFLAFTKNLRY